MVVPVVVAGVVVAVADTVKAVVLDVGTASAVVSVATLPSDAGVDSRVAALVAVMVEERPKVVS